MVNLKHLYFAIHIVWQVTGCHLIVLTAENNLNKSEPFTRFYPNVTLLDEIIRPSLSTPLYKIEKVSSTTEGSNSSAYEVTLLPHAKYQAKIKEAEKYDVEDDLAKFEWLREANQFNRNTTGIIFTGTMDLEVLTQDFCRVMSIKGGNSTNTLLNAITDRNYTCTRTCWQMVFYLKNLDKIPSPLPKLVHTNSIVLISVSLDESLMETIKIRQNIQTFGVQYGYSFEADDCEAFIQTSRKLKPYVYNILRDPKSRMYTFLFKETLDRIQGGATRMFRRRLVLFEECRNFVLNHRNSNHTTELGFVLEEYYKMNDFYESRRDIQVFVKYIDLLSNWAEAQNSTVVYIGTDLDTNQTAGWYSRDNISSRFNTKREKALKLSISQYTPPTSTTGLSTQNILLIACVPLVFISLLFVSAFYFVRRHYKTTTFTDDEIHKFLYGNQFGESDEFYMRNLYDIVRYEIPEESFTINDNEVLGSGEFGRVCRGTITTIDGETKVAVKTPNPLKFHKNIVHGLLSEIKVLAYLDKHKNIAKLWGANTFKLKQGKVFIFLELCELGSLENYLRNISVETTTNGDNLNATIYAELYKWSTEICNGMSYLAERRVVHADLATRNVLLNVRKEAKLCDFGLSKRMLNYKNKSYVSTGQEISPWKWMAPESLKDNNFSEKSDVWAFGVTFWEIYSLGEVPYPGLPWEVDFPQRLEDGFHLSEPKYDENDMYSLMMKCWNVKSYGRPLFSELQFMLQARKHSKTHDYASLVLRLQ